MSKYILRFITFIVVDIPALVLTWLDSFGFIDWLLKQHERWERKKQVNSEALANIIIADITPDTDYRCTKDMSIAEVERRRKKLMELKY